MSLYQNHREDFLAEVVRFGWRATPEVTAKWQELLPAHILDIWLARHYRPAKKPLVRRGQFINRCLVGCDPEFYFQASGGRVNANDLSLKAGLAWGADNNGRLAEMRPAPSRSTLEVVASLASELRWLSWLRPDLRDYSWHGGAWNHQDGLGGHIHFGRLRDREREVAALDLLAYWLSELGVFDRAGWRERIRRKNYGKLGDVRPQRWGWEYRTFPSWIDSPWLAFFTLTLAKLVVFDPEMFGGLTPSTSSSPINATQIRDRLTSLLAYYQHRDDDAQLAYAVLTRRGFPSHDQSDFRPRWGLFAAPPNLPRVDVVPSTVAPTGEEVCELGDALLAGRAPDPVSFEPNWRPSQLPGSDYSYLPDLIQTYHCPGLGELVVGLCGAKAYLPKISGIAQESKRIYVPENLEASWPRSWKRELLRRIPECDPRAGEGSSIQIGTGFDWKRDLPALRDWLLSGLLPIWRVEDVEVGSLKRWLAAQKHDKQQPIDKYSKAL